MLDCGLAAVSFNCLELTAFLDLFVLRQHPSGIEVQRYGNRCHLQDADVPG